MFSAFTLSAAFVTTGLGKRIAYLLIGKIGNTTLGLVTLRYSRSGIGSGNTV